MNRIYKSILSLTLALVMVMGGVASAASMVFYDFTDGNAYYDDNMSDTEVDKLVDAVVKGNRVAKAVGGDKKLVNYEEYKGKIEQVLIKAIKDGKTNEQATEEAIKAVPGIIEGLEELEVPVETELEVTSISAINRTTFKVEFNMEVEAKAENFQVEGLKVEKVALSEDNKVVTVTTDEMKYNEDYKVTVLGLTEEAIVTSFTSKPIEDLWTLEIDAPEAIKADGISTKVVKFRLLDSEGKIDEKANDIVLDLNSTYGYLSQKRLTMQKGYGEVVLRSEFTETEVRAKLDAQIINASERHEDLIGKVEAESAYVLFNHDGTGDGGEVVTVKSLVSVNSNEADRVTLIFNENLDAKDIYQYNKDGEIILGENDKLPKLRDGITIKQGEESDGKEILGAAISKRNPKALVVYLKKDKVNLLTDNKDVYVDVNIGRFIQGSKSFKLADARKPNLTGVEALSNRAIEVTFSEGILESKFVLDGRFAQTDENNKELFKVVYGDVVWDEDAEAYVDNRSKVTITLTENYQEPEKDSEGKNVYPNGIFKPGKHSVQASSIKDFAAHTDKNNIGTTQSLAFDIEEDKSNVEIVRFVDSPEQFRIKFNKLVKFDTENNDIKEAIDFKYKDDKGKWQSVVDENGLVEYFKGDSINVDSLFGSKELLKLTKLTTENSTEEYLIELRHDWTKIYNTAETNDNYYNDEFAIVFAKESVVNPANGKKNVEEIVLNLTDGTVLATPDITSPKIVPGSIVKVKGFDAVDKPNFNVEMTEPVKLLKGTNDTHNKEGDTLAQNQETLPETKVEFLGKDKDGKTRTLPGKVVGFSDELDKVIEVEWTGDTTPQKLVNDGGSEEWTLVIKSISDDVGNTSATAEGTFTLKAADKEIGKFRVDPENGTAVGEEGLELTFGVKGEKHNDKDIVEVRFTAPVATTGVGSAVDVKNYTLNGVALPSGTDIRITETDDDTDYETITITLPAGTLGKDADRGVLTLSSSLESAEGKAITGDLAFTFTIDNKIVTVDEAKAEAQTELAKVEKPEDVKSLVNQAITVLQNSLDSAKTFEEVGIVRSNIDQFVQLAKDAAEAGQALEDILNPGA